MGKQKHDLGVRKRAMNEKANPEPLTRAARVEKRYRERMASRGRLPQQKRVGGYRGAMA